MKTSQRGLELLQEREGCKLTAYQDAAGVWTIGYGQTGPYIVRGTVWTQQEANEAFSKAVIMREVTLGLYVKVPLSQNKFDALISFVYNVGTAAFKTSTLLKHLNQSDYAAAYKQFAVWNKITSPKTGKLITSVGLTKRRRSEAAQFNTPDAILGDAP